MTKMLSSKTLTAKKSHRCDFCGMPIDIGQQYNRSFNVGDSAYTWKSHMHCDKLVDKLVYWDDLDDGGCSYDDFWQHIAAEWEKINNKSSNGQSYRQMLDEVRKYHEI